MPFRHSWTLIMKLEEVVAFRPMQPSSSNPPAADHPRTAFAALDTTAACAQTCPSFCSWRLHAQWPRQRQNAFSPRWSAHWPPFATQWRRNAWRPCCFCMSAHRQYTPTAQCLKFVASGSSSPTQVKNIRYANELFTCFYEDSEDNRTVNESRISFELLKSISLLFNLIRTWNIQCENSEWRDGPTAIFSC